MASKYEPRILFVCYILKFFCYNYQVQWPFQLDAGFISDIAPTMSAHFLNLDLNRAGFLALWISRDLNLDHYLIDFEVPDRSYAAFPGRDEGGCLHRLLVSKLCFGLVLLLTVPIIVLLLEGAPLLKIFTTTPEQLKVLSHGSLKYAC